MGEALMTPDAFLDSFTDSTYCDLNARPRTAKALIKLAERIPDGIANDLPRIVVFAPNPDDYGFCIPLITGHPNGTNAFIYLGPSLERQSQLISLLLQITPPVEYSAFDPTLTD
jgi:hypothetical protein